jgi:hypothetical protein
MICYFIPLFIFGRQLLPISPPPESVSVLRHFSFHIGIMTDGISGPRWISKQIPFWISEFLNSSNSDGLHLVSESILPNISLPHALVNLRSLDRSVQQSQKRCRSLSYFLANSTANFFLFINHDTYVWPRNFRHLVEEITSRGLSSDSNFILGQCMANWEGTFLQGAAVLHSRVAAQRALHQCEWYIQDPARSEDVGFRRVMSAIELGNMANATSPHFLGQYIAPRDLGSMERMDFTTIQKCPERPIAIGSCAPVWGRFNRLVTWHMLSKLGSQPPPRPIYAYPNNLFWFQRTEVAEMCIRPDIQ